MNLNKNEKGDGTVIVKKMAAGDKERTRRRNKWAHLKFPTLRVGRHQ
jgi:hypothetical protein